MNSSLSQKKKTIERSVVFKPEEFVEKWTEQHRSYASFTYCCAPVAEDGTAPAAAFDSDVTVTWPVETWRRWRAETNCCSKPNIFNPYSSFLNWLLSLISAF